MTHSVCAGACWHRSSPGAVPAMGKATGREAQPTQRRRQRTERLTQAQKTHTPAWCYCLIRSAQPQSHSQSKPPCMCVKERTDTWSVSLMLLSVDAAHVRTAPNAERLRLNLPETKTNAETQDEPGRKPGRLRRATSTPSL